MRNEPKRVTRYPILLSSTRQNNDVSSNFFEVWLDDKYQEDFVYCQASCKIVTRQKRNNYNLVRHLKMFNHKSNKPNEECSIPDVQMREAGDAPRQSGSTSERDGESTGANCEVATCDGDEASAATASACETERETGSTSTTASISPTHLPELEANSKGERVSLLFFIRGHSSSNYHIEAPPSDANLVASHTSELDAQSTSSTSEPEAASTSSTSEPEPESTYEPEAESTSEPEAASTSSTSEP